MTAYTVIRDRFSGNIQSNAANALISSLTSQHFENTL